MAPDLPVIAVVEDDAATLTAYARLLRAGGFEPAPYASAEAFLAATPRRAPACLLLDIQLGGMSGVDLQQQLRASRSSLPIIVVTATDAPDACAESTRLGCTAYLRKDVDGSIILDMIRRLTADAAGA